ncbi:MAG TPA: DUF5709 domain-containing protein [Acidimicrobiales bacterium]|nr:DUF5709 domain-containing protein [Acidimicrobiales bacterium]
MRDTNPTENPEVDGIPVVDQPAPGQDVETSEEWNMSPRDHPLAIGTDPAYPVTPAEHAIPESVADRADRELPDVGQGGGEDDLDSIGGRLMDPDSDVSSLDETAEAVADLGEAESALTAEEAAMHVVSEDVADDLDPAIERAEYLEGN